jgi:CHAT domain-containing protein
MRQRSRRSCPPKAALVEFMRLSAFDPKATNGKPRWLPPRYYALVVRAGKSSKPRHIDLGPAETIDAAIASLRTHLEETPQQIVVSGEAFVEEQYRELSRDLYDRVWLPTAEAVGDAATVYVAPDSELNRFAFETLNDEKGKYLAERYRIAYLTSGRDLLRGGDLRGTGTVIVAGPDFDVDADARRRALASTAIELTTPTLPEIASVSAPPTGEVRGGAWLPLPGAAAEADDLAPLLDRPPFGPVHSFVGPQAQEELLKRLKAPRVLHIATHGYFVADAPETAPDRDEGLTRGRLFGSAVGLSRLRTSDNPLLRSGIVLAGANLIATPGGTVVPTSKQSADDGWLTAIEIAALDLHGTELVVLSACETGLGDTPIGEGVQGLRRAFLYAGCETLVTSLYKVPDADTRSLMREFYTRLSAGDDKLTAFSKARLNEMQRRRNEKGVAHPFFWGSFILVGNPQMTAVAADR